MKMPSAIDNDMFAPCGINCMVCYKHCYSKKPCCGCLAGDTGKPEHCRSCKIKSCADSRGYKYCFECTDFACRLIKNLEKSYNKRYGASLINNSIMVRDLGINAFMSSDRGRWTCKSCGGVVSLHDRECSECGEKAD